jgi:TPP-dependent pyruvate/acetoin dehydrogenase alpha subunit
MAGNAKSSANLLGTAKSKAGSLIPGSLIPDEKLRTLYETMLQCRALEARARLLGKADRFPLPNASMTGQEAIEVGCTVDLRAGDRVVSSDRDFIFKFIQGLPLSATLLQVDGRPGDADETNASLPSLGKIVEPSLNGCGPFETAARLALENKNRGVVVAFSPDDSASRRSSLQAWDEALALARAQYLPILFVVQCVPRGASTRLKERANSKDLSSRAQRHGFPGIPVDGNDVVAVYRVAYESLERARRGGGPTLIECKTYSYDDQAKPSHKEKSRSQGSVDGWGRDPIQYMERYLSRKGLFAEAWKNQVAGEFARRLDAVFGTAGPPTCH